METLPLFIKCHIFNELPLKDIFALSLTSTKISRDISNDLFWNHRVKKEFPELHGQKPSYMSYNQLAQRRYAATILIVSRYEPRVEDIKLTNVVNFSLENVCYAADIWGKLYVSDIKGTKFICDQVQYACNSKYFINFQNQLISIKDSQICGQDIRQFFESSNFVIILYRNGELHMNIRNRGLKHVATNVKFFCIQADDVVLGLTFSGSVVLIMIYPTMVDLGHGVTYESRVTTIISRGVAKIRTNSDTTYFVSKRGEFFFADSDFYKFDAANCIHRTCKTFDDKYEIMDFCSLNQYDRILLVKKR